MLVNLSTDLEPLNPTFKPSVLVIKPYFHLKNGIQSFKIMVLSCSFYENPPFEIEKVATTKNVSLQKDMMVFKQKKRSK